MEISLGGQAEHQPHRGRDPESLKLGFANQLKYGLAVDRFTATPHDRFLALATVVRDRLVERWIETQQTHHLQQVKRVYYLSLEYLMGRALHNNLTNLRLEESVGQALRDLELSEAELLDEEVDAGLGNGGLGRLAACFMDSLATLEIPALGYGLRYDYGIFRQRIDHGYQVEEPDDWLSTGNPWEIPRPDYRIPVHFGGRVVGEQVHGRTVFRWLDTRPVIGIPYDTPIVGYGGKTVNTLRLWSARAAKEFDFADFNEGDYIGAVESKVKAENLTKVLYPNDSMYAGKELRLRQQYFFVACSLYDILRRFKKTGLPWAELPNQIAVQLNDTHPSLAVPELMRLLLDHEGLDWEPAWDATVRSLAYTNHTLLPEALERWPVELLQQVLPRHLQIIYEINHRFLRDVAARWPGDAARLARMSLIEEQPVRQVRMAYLSIVGTHSTNGVAELHTELLKTRVVPDFHEMYPERFNAKTNGVTPRRWLLLANPPLAALLTATLGEGWITDLSQLRRLAPLAEDPAFRARFRAVKHQAKAALAAHLKAQFGFVVCPETLFDVQVKRLHEYKRQLLNVLHILVLYNRLRKNPDLDLVPRTFLFGAKAAPGYFLAKLIIKLINNVGRVLREDPVCGHKLAVFFIPDYRVSLAERIIPAADVSEQISTAGMEASGTGNMKFMLNGALTVGTLDGANVEMLQEAGEENIFIFGLTAAQVAEWRGRYSPWWHYQNDAETREALDLLSSGHFDLGEPGVFQPLRQSLLEHGDPYMLLADLPSYAQAQGLVQELYRNPEEWTRKAILNVAAAGKFSSDRTISEYAREIWRVEPCPIDPHHKLGLTLIQARGQAPGAARKL